MKRRLTVSILVLTLWAGLLSAQTMMIERARELAPEPEKARLAYVAGNAETPDFCVFNDAEKKGFVIVASDTLFGDGLVLGYSDEGEFDYDRLPDNAKWLLSQYREQIEYLRRNDIGNTVRTTAGTDNNAVAPLLAGVRWDQTEPYNLLCPNDAMGRSLSGCVATAMAQVMWYFRWPLEGTGYHSYVWTSGTGRQTLSVNYSQSDYDWSLMPGKYLYGQYSDEQAAAVAKLMYDCGVSVNMAYTSSVSGAYMSYVIPAMSSYFGYRQVKYKYDPDNAYDRESLLKSELDSRRPVLVGADGASGGHAFVCDGYDSNGYFHYNFGWGGLGNGYYLLSVAGGFPDNQEYIYNIIPNRNKLTDNGISYNRLCPDKVEVTYPDDLSRNYSGRVAIPAQVTFDTLESDVTSIGPYALAESDVTVLDIPASVRTIESNAFFMCSMLDTVYVHWDSPLDCETDAFDNTVYSNAVLVVPDGKADVYSRHRTWSLFGTVITAGETAAARDWTEWEPVSESASRYRYAWSDMFADLTDSVAVYFRQNVKSADKAQFKIDNWLSSLLVIDVNLKTGQCKVQPQTTGIVYYTEELLACDCPSFSPEYSYGKYPCCYDSEHGILSLNLIYGFSLSGAYFQGTDSVFLYGYPQYDVILGEAEVGEYGDVTCSVKLARDAVSYGYTVLPGKLSDQERASVFKDMQSGAIELEYTDLDILTAQLTESDAYTIMAVSVDACGMLQKYATQYVTYMAARPEWVEEYRGQYRYQIWKKITQKDVVLYHDSNNPRFWKLSNMYNGSEFTFRWYDDGRLEFDRQPSGFLNGSSSVIVSDNKYSSEPKKGSYYDSTKGVLYFDTFYSSSTRKYGWEAFVMETRTAVPGVNAGPVSEPAIYNMSGQKLDHAQKGLNIIGGRKFYE